MKKTIVSVLALALASAMILCSCGKKKEDGTLKISGKSVDVGSVMKIDGEEVPFDLFRYCYLTAKASVLEEDEKADLSDANVRKKILSNAVERVKQIYATEKLAAKYGYELSQEKKDSVDSTMKNVFDNAGGATNYRAILEENFLNHETYLCVLNANTLLSAMQENLIGSDKKTNKLVFSEDEVLKSFAKDYYHMQSIVIPISLTDSQGASLDAAAVAKNKAEAEKKANAAYNELKSSDFAAVMKKYNTADATEDSDQNYYPVKKLSELFGSDLTGIKVGEYSAVLYAENNFYIFCRTENDNEYLKKNSMSSIYSACCEQMTEEIAKELKITELEHYKDVNPDTVV